MGYSQDEISFSVLEISQAIGKGEPFIKLAKALGIQWYMMADGDRVGSDYIGRANDHLADDENIANRAQKLSHPDVEHEFWHNGYDDFISNMVDAARKHTIEQQSAGNENEKIKLLIKAAIKYAGGKPAFAHLLAEEVKRRGSDTIPQTIKTVINRVVELAED